MTGARWAPASGSAAAGRLLALWRVAGLLALALGGACSSRPVDHPADVALLLEGGGCACDGGFAPLPESEVPRVEPPSAEPYHLGVGDVVHVSVPGSEQFAGLGETSKGEIVGTAVKEDGNLYLPVVKMVPAAGRTVIEIQADVQERLKKVLPDPFVSIDVIEHRSQKFYVLGEVLHPGAFSVDGSTTLIEAVSMAGGFKTEDADVQGAYVMRDGRVLPISVVDLTRRGDMRSNVRMRDKDLVFVPHLQERKVYVLGEVKTPGVVPMDREGKLTLVAALAVAGGLDKINAADDQIRIFRGGWDRPCVYTISAHEVYKYGEDVLLAPGDRIFVAPTGLATWGRAMQHVFPFLQGATTLAALGLSAAAISKN